uniref:Uncharacterized protein n=1 Tax=Lotus japonicus TaxID=34305 RepID=I3SAJ0_LOTJA|nr:unknown [Lotus japonicus]
MRREACKELLSVSNSLQKGFLLLSQFLMKFAELFTLEQLKIEPLQHQIMGTVLRHNRVLNILGSVTKEFFLGHEINVGIFRLEVFASLYSFKVVSFLIHQVVQLQGGKIHRRPRPFRFHFHAILLQQNRAIRLAENDEVEEHLSDEIAKV